MIGTKTKKLRVIDDPFYKDEDKSEPNPKADTNPTKENQKDGKGTGKENIKKV